MPLISNMVHQNPSISDTATIIVERDNLPRRISGANFKSESNNLINAQNIYYFYRLNGDFRPSETRGEFYLFGKSLLESLGYDLYVNDKSKGIPLYTLIDSGSGYVESNKGYLYHEFDQVNDTAYIKVVFSSDNVEIYEYLDDTAIDIAVKTFYGTLPNSSNWFREIEVGENLVAKYSVDDSRNSLRYENITAISNELLGNNLINDPRTVEDEWTYDSAWSITDNGLYYDAYSSNQILSKNISISESEIYKLNISVESTGTMRLGIFDNSDNPIQDYTDFITGDYEYLFQSKSASALKIVGLTDGDAGYITEVSLKHMLDGDITGDIYIIGLQDQKGTNDISQGVESYQPEVNSIYTDVKSISFSTGKNLSFDSVITLSEGSLFLVVKPNTSGTEVVLGSSLSVNNRISFDSDLHTIIVKDSAGEIQTLESELLYDGIFHVVTVSFSDGECTVYVDSETIGSFTGFNGFENIDSLGLSQFNGEIHSVLVSSQEIGAIDLEQLHSYFLMSLGYHSLDELGINEQEVLGFGV